MNKPTIEAAIIEANRAKNPTRAVIDYDRRAKCMDVLIDAARYREPMKPVEGYKCPNCGLEFLRTFKYCMMCGQSLDWT